MLKSIEYFSYLLGISPLWMLLIIVLLVILGVVKSLYPWQPKWKSEETKDKNGNKITKYYYLGE